MYTKVTYNYENGWCYLTSPLKALLLSCLATCLVTANDAFKSILVLHIFVPCSLPKYRCFNQRWVDDIKLEQGLTSLFSK